MGQWPYQNTEDVIAQYKRQQKSCPKKKGGSASARTQKTKRKRERQKARRDLGLAPDTPAKVVEEHMLLRQARVDRNAGLTFNQRTRQRKKRSKARKRKNLEAAYAIEGHPWLTANCRQGIHAEDKCGVLCECICHGLTESKETQ